MADWVSTGELARALGVSRSAVLQWQRAGRITPAFTTPGGHARWDVDAVREEIKRARE